MSEDLGCDILKLLKEARESNRIGLTGDELIYALQLAEDNEKIKKLISSVETFIDKDLVEIADYKFRITNSGIDRLQH